MTEGLVHFFSDSHRFNHLLILALEVGLPTFTVGIILPQLHDIAKQVSSKNELCSEYGTPNIRMLYVDFCEGWRSV